MTKVFKSIAKAQMRFHEWRIKYFPERQLFLRSEGRVRFLTIHSYTQLASATAITAALGWGVVTSYAYLSRDFVIEDKNNTISNMSAEYQTLSNDFSALEAEVERRARLLEERQQFLEEFVEAPAKSNVINSDAPETDVLEDDETAEELSLIDSIFGASSKSVPTLSNIDRRHTLLTRLQEMEARQRTLAQNLAQQAKSTLTAIDMALAETKLTTDLLIEKSTPQQLATGGPFIPDTAFDGIFDANDGTPFLDLKENSDRLKMVTNALNSYPVGKPAEDYYLSSRFGRRRDPFKKTWARHPGLDLAGWPGTAILATAPGKVVHAGWYGPYGNMVEVDHGNGFRTRYGHMRKVHVKKDDKITLGHRVGEMGKTGRATDTHVHYEVWFDDNVTDPMPFMKAAENVLEIQGRYEKTSE